MATKNNLYPTATHWGQYLVETDKNELIKVNDYTDESDPSAIGQALLDNRNRDCRITKPMIRKSFLAKQNEHTGELRGKEAFVPVSWDEATDIAAEALTATKNEQGNSAIFGGSYGWASSGRFHHAQSQIHRFLNCLGGYTRSEHSYSVGAGEVILPHILGYDLYTLFQHTTPWSDVAEFGELVVSFGGIPEKNLQVVMGGTGNHNNREQLFQCKKRNVQFINISPLKSDMPEYLEADWIPIKPGTDTALILAICKILIEEKMYDRDFLNKYTVGFSEFEESLTGSSDGTPKTANWAEEITGIPKTTIVALARRMAGSRCFLTMGWSLQRAEHGEQPFWASTALVAMLGQFGLPGGGIGHGIGSISSIGFSGRKILPFSWGRLPQGENPIDSVIPVARICDALKHPGKNIQYNGREISYPHIELIYWAGGNIFHHHQDLNRLQKAWKKPRCIIINEQVWTATAKHADIVLPINTSLERNDLHFSTFDHYVTPMRQALQPLGDSKSDYEVFSKLAEKLGFQDSFTEKRNEMDWIRSIYDFSVSRALKHDIELPDFETFWAGEHFSIKEQIKEVKLIPELFREDPEKNPLKTPSGKIEIFSKTISDFGYSECKGIPTWFDKTESLGSPLSKEFPLHLISNQPANRLHSQLDFSVVSKRNKVSEREVTTMNQKDAADRGIKNGDLIRIFNQRGACLSAARLSTDIRQGVIQLPTGAWYDPSHDANGKDLESHGNPNVLTRDQGTSELAQGTTAHSCLVEVEKYLTSPPPVRAFLPPKMDETN